MKETTKEQNEDESLAKIVSVADKGTQLSLEKVVISDKEVQVSVENIIGILDQGVQVSIEVEGTSKKELEVVDLPAVCDNLIFDYLPWLEVVDEPKDFYNLEKKLMFGMDLQTVMVIYKIFSFNSQKIY